MSESKLQIDVADLCVGMYICELDIPWLDSPFLFQGFELDSQDLIDEVTQVCQFVYVDPEQTAVDVRANLQSLSENFCRRLQQSGTLNQDKRSVTARYDYLEHLQLARKIYSNTRSYVEKTHKNVQIRAPIDVQQAKSLVRSLAENILINPNAMMWLTHLKKRHEYTLTHSINVCILALIFGGYLRLDRAEVELLGLGALLHDIGKLRIPTEILDKPGRLSKEEFEIMKAHPVEGHDILKDDPHIPPESLEIVLHHHERINGAGYPSQMTGEQIGKLIKLTSIVDVYDAITSDRCYHDGVSPYKALQNIYSWTEGHFEKAFVEQFMGCMGIYPVGTIVKLNDGQQAVVISATEKTKLRPIVLLIKDAQQKYYDKRIIFNLSSQEWDDTGKRLEVSDVIEPKDSDIKVSLILEQESLTPQHSPSHQSEVVDEVVNELAGKFNSAEPSAPDNIS